MSKLISIIIAALVILTSVSVPTYAGDWRRGNDRFERTHEHRNLRRDRRDFRREMRRERRELRRERREVRREVRRSYRYRSYRHRHHGDNNAALAIGAFALGTIVGSVINNQNAQQQFFPPAPQQPVQRAPAAGCLC